MSQAIAVGGNIITGFEFIGPFPSYDAAVAYVEQYCDITFTVGDLEPPAYTQLDEQPLKDFYRYAFLAGFQSASEGTTDVPIDVFYENHIETHGVPGDLPLSAQLEALRAKLNNVEANRNVWEATATERAAIIHAQNRELEALRTENEELKTFNAVEIERLRKELRAIANRGVPVQREEPRMARNALAPEPKP